MIGTKLLFVLILGVSLALIEAQDPRICWNSNVNPHGGLIAHESTCKHFYKCNYGEPVIMTCPGVLLWNDNQKVCDWPANVPNCGGTTPDTTPTVGTTPSYNEHRPCRYIPSVSCPVHDPNGYAVHLPNPDDCRKFYKCDWGKPYSFDCPSGLHFNTTLEVCDWPNNAKCAC